VRAAGYPWLPALYVAATALFCVNLLAQRPLYTWPGLIIVALGIPVYFGWRAVVRAREPGGAA
jgi:APA family basic amino acid/polyamine antiporter